jgi:hypothetical protein
MAAAGLVSRGQPPNSKPDIAVIGTSDSVKKAQNDKGIYTKYEYTDSNGKSIIIQNSFPRGGGTKYIDPKGQISYVVIFWTRITNETDNPLKLEIDFSGDSYEFPSTVGSSVGSYFKILLPSDTMTRDKESLFNYGVPDLKSFLDNNVDKPSSLKRTINPKNSSAFYVVRLSLPAQLPGDGNGTTRAELSLKGQNLFYTLNGKEIHCGSINLKNSMLQK